MTRLQRIRSLARLHPWFAVVGVTVLAIWLIELVSIVSGAPTHRFLLWNLFLAWIPLPLAAGAYVAQRLGFGLPVLAPLLIGWLLFFPNAPYIVTDLIHFGGLNRGIPAELDLATLVVAASAGLLVGFASLYVVQRVVGRRYGLATSRASVVAVLVLSSFGVYLGRVLRWNSWDAFADPSGILTDVATRLVHPFAFREAWMGIAVFAVLLLVTYAYAVRLAIRPLARADRRSS
jgi:uncharacterized membrane protein